MNSTAASNGSYREAPANPVNLEVFEFRVSTGLIRYGVIFALSLIITHIRFGLTPFNEGYQFPLHLFFTIFSFGVILCTASWIATNLCKHTIFSKGLFDFRNVISFLGINAMVVVVVFIGLYLYRNHPRPFAINYFFAYLMVSFAVVTIENLLFLVYAMSQVRKTQEIRQERIDMLVVVGKKSYRLEFDNISHVQLEDGIIVFYTADNKRINSQFNTLDQVAQELPSDKFYRANRQYILHRNAIKYITKDKNRKLLVHINGQVPGQDIVVSRYKNKEIKEWLNMKLG